MPHFTEASFTYFTPGIPSAFNSSTNPSLSGKSSSNAAVNISPAAPMPQSIYSVFTRILLFRFLVYRNFLYSPLLILQIRLPDSVFLRFPTTVSSNLPSRQCFPAIFLCCFFKSAFQAVLSGDFPLLFLQIRLPGSVIRVSDG